ncbi:ATP-binding protein [Geoglobus sp.]
MDVLEEVIVEFHRLGLPEVKGRELELPVNINKAITVIGLRRVGKTYLLYQTMQELLKSLRLENIFYVNFEDNRLEGISSKDLSRIVELYKKYNPESKTMYLFFDEIQSVAGWEKFVRRLLERRDVRVFITGSSSKLLSKEIATSLRGRSLSFKLFPLSFREFLAFKGFEAKEPFIEDERGRIERDLEEYLQFGGFPEIVNYDVHLKIRTLQEYLDMVVYKDLVERYGIEKISVMKALIRLLVKNFSKRVSIRSIYNSLSSGMKLSRNTVYEYFSYLEDMGFVLPVRKFSFSEKESTRSIAKLYVVDNGFPTIYGLKDSGHRMENVVAIELLRRKHYFNPLLNVYYWHDRQQREVDFVVTEGLKVKELIQVCYDVEDINTKKREINALLKASKDVGCSNLYVITWDYEGVEDVEGKKVRFISLWKWLYMKYQKYGPAGV